MKSMEVDVRTLTQCKDSFYKPNKFFPIKLAQKDTKQWKLAYLWLVVEGLHGGVTACVDAYVEAYGCVQGCVLTNLELHESTWVCDKVCGIMSC